MKIYYFFCLFIGFSFFAQGQNGIIKGTVTNALNNEPIAFASVLIEGTDQGATTDLDGNYEVSNLDPGLYNVRVSYIGFTEKRSMRCR
jgi:hypothetical protein